MGPPDDVRGGVVALNLVLARSQKAVVAVGSATAYPTGIEFAVDVHWRVGEADAAWHPGAWRHRRDYGGELPDDLFRVGVELADGSRATTLDATPPGSIAPPVAVESFGAVVATAGDEKPRLPEPPVLVLRGGGGGSQSWSQSLWLWPLPPEGPLTFVCEWPAFDIPLSRAVVDAAPIREAAARSQPLWDDRVSP
jgi:hypothetical protein